MRLIRRPRRTLVGLARGERGVCKPCGMGWGREVNEMGMRNGVSCWIIMVFEVRIG